MTLVLGHVPAVVMEHKRAGGGLNVGIIASVLLLILPPGPEVGKQAVVCERTEWWVKTGSND